MKTALSYDGKTAMISDDGAIHFDNGGNICATEFRFNDKVPHWQRYGDGVAFMKLDGTVKGVGIDKTWLSIDTTESGEKSSKRTMITLDIDQIERLRDMCDIVLGQTRAARVIDLSDKRDERVRAAFGQLQVTSQQVHEMIDANACPVRLQDFVRDIERWAGHMIEGLKRKAAGARS